MTRPSKRPHADHAKVAARMRKAPGRWFPVGIYRSTPSAQRIARNIETGYRCPMYEPAGAFETRLKLLEFDTQVFARYVGPRPARGGAR